MMNALRTPRVRTILLQSRSRLKEKRHSASTIRTLQESRRNGKGPSALLLRAPQPPSSHQHLAANFSARRCFSSDTANPIVYKNDKLVKTLVNPHLDSIRQLPEIENALQHWDSPEALEEFQRAVQVFEMMQTGGRLHIATMTLLAECFHHQGNYQEASRTLQTLKKLVSTESDETRLLMDLASAKCFWYQGDFESSMMEVHKMMENDASHDSDLMRGCVMNAEGMVRLMNAPNERDEGGNSVVQVLKIAFKLIKKDSCNSSHVTLASASASGNLGVAMVITRLGLNESEPEPDTLDETLCAFRDGLNMLEQMDGSTVSPSFAATANAIRSRLYCNMAWTLLQQEDELKLASEYSSTALSFAEKLEAQVSPQEYHGALGRSLRLVASCYARADSALTAEGLFQSAIVSLEKASCRDPLVCLDLRDAHDNYASLLSQWDKRSRDAEIQQERATAVNESLSEGWKDKSSICSGLTFISP